MWSRCPCGALVYDIDRHLIYHATYPIPPELLVEETP